LLGAVIRNGIDGDGGVIVHSSYDPIHEAFIKPLFAFRESNAVKMAGIAFHRGATDVPVEGVVSPVDIVSKHAIQRFKGVHSGRIKAVQPGILDGTKRSFNLSFCSTVSYRGVNFNDTKGTKDEGKLLI
jgi:hypothetical protein